MPALAAQVFLLVTFAVLGPEKGQGHYLSVGLCGSLVMLEVSFVRVRVVDVRWGWGCWILRGKGGEDVDVWC